MTLFVQLATTLEDQVRRWQTDLSETGDFDDDLLEQCADSMLEVGSSLRWLSGCIADSLDATDDDVLQRLPDEAQEFVDRFRAAEPVEAPLAEAVVAALDGFSEVRVLMQEYERWDHDEDRTLDHLRRAATLLGREDWDEAELEEWLDGQTPTNRPGERGARSDVGRSGPDPHPTDRTQTTP